MATLPRASNSISEAAGTVSAGTDAICVLSPVATQADMVPRQFGTADAIYAIHGFCEGVEYAALHADKTGKPILFVGLPINTAGAISRQNTAGNTGACVSTIVAGGSGVLAEHEGVLTVERGGTVGTDQIVLGLSLDGGRTSKSVRLSTATSYAVPFYGITIGLTAATLVTGDTIHTWFGSAPRASMADVATARANLAAQQKQFRSFILCQDLVNDTEAAAYRDQLDAFASANDRYVYGRASVYDRAPLASMSRTTARMTGTPTLTFLEVGATSDTITRSSGSFIADGFVAGDTITVAGSAGNNVTGVVATVGALVLTLDTTDLVSEGPVAGCSVVGYPTLTFAEVGASADTIVRSRGSWLTDGFRDGCLVTVTGTASNNITAASVTTVTASTLTLGTTDLAAEVIGTNLVTLSAGQAKAAWMAEVEAEFATIDGAPRIDLSAGRGRQTSAFSGWYRRIPAAWFASFREFQHDVHIATWRKSDGPVGADLYDADGTLVEWDDRVDGGAGSAARFTTLRSWANGPVGGFVTLSLTRGADGTLQSLTHNKAVINVGQTVVQRATETACIGRLVQLNTDGTATKEDLSAIAGEVNAAVEDALLSNKGEGPRASSAIWTPATTDVLNIAEPLLNGVLTIQLNGTIHSVNTVIRVLAGGQS